jgi:hypothetical protein
MMLERAGLLLSCQDHTLDEQAEAVERQLGLLAELDD